jgi:hypothetical protein
LPVLERAAAARRRPDPERRRDDAEEDRPGDRARLDRRDGQERGERTEEDPERAGGGWIAQSCSERVL